MGNKHWTNAELLTLGELYREGLSYTQIASKMNRSRSAIAYALSTYRYVINVPYRKDPDKYGEPPLFARPTLEQQRKIEEQSVDKKPWWKLW